MEDGRGDYGQLEKEIGNNDPEINACRVRLELKQM